MDSNSNEKYIFDASKLARTLFEILKSEEERVLISEQMRETVAQMTKTMFSVSSYINSEDVIIPALDAMAKEAAPLITEWSKLSPLYAQLLTHTSPVTLTPAISTSARVEPVVKEALATAQKAIPYAEVNLDKAQITTLSESTKAPQSWWSFDHITVLLGILITLFFGILSTLPDKQLKKIIKQNELIIENQEKQLEETKESNEELIEVLQDLNESIEALSEELDILRKQADSTRDCDEPSSDCTDTDGQADATDD